MNSGTPQSEGNARKQAFKQRIVIYLPPTVPNQKRGDKNDGTRVMKGNRLRHLRLKSVFPELGERPILGRRASPRGGGGLWIDFRRPGEAECKKRAL